MEGGQSFKFGIRDITIIRLKLDFPVDDFQAYYCGYVSSNAILGKYPQCPICRELEVVWWKCTVTPFQYTISDGANSSLLLERIIGMTDIIILPFSKFRAFLHLTI